MLTRDGYSVSFLCLCCWEESLSSWLLELAITTDILNKTMSPPNKTTIDFLTLQEENTSSDWHCCKKRREKPSFSLPLNGSGSGIRNTPEYWSNPIQQVLLAPVTQTQMCIIVPRNKPHIPQRKSQSNKNKTRTFFKKQTNKKNQTLDLGVQPHHEWNILLIVSDTVKTVITLQSLNYSHRIQHLKKSKAFVFPEQFYKHNLVIRICKHTF